MATSRRAWTEAEMRGALSRLVAAAYGKLEDFPMSIPGQPGDADVLLCDAIDELLEFRAKQRARETTKNVLKRLARHYDGRAKVARHLMNQTTDLEVAARHAANALEWETRRQTILTVARNLEIVLDERPEEVPSSTQAQTISLNLDGRTRTSSVQDRLRGLIDTLPAAVKAWLRTVDWPYKSWPRISFEQEMVSLDWDQESGEPRWFSRWKAGPHVTVIVHDANCSISHQAIFRVEDNGAWTQVLFAGKVQS